MPTAGYHLTDSFRQRQRLRASRKSVTESNLCETELSRLNQSLHENLSILRSPAPLASRLGRSSDRFGHVSIAGLNCPNWGGNFGEFSSSQSAPISRSRSAQLTLLCWSIDTENVPRSILLDDFYLGLRLHRRAQSSGGKNYDSITRYPPVNPRIGTFLAFTVRRALLRYFLVVCWVWKPHQFLRFLQGQAWNMTFSFYQSLRTVPRELDEAVTLYRLSGWQRFTKLELPSAAIGLVWNGMMSFGGGWFFVVASEAISVLNQNYTLPGVGSYVAAAIAAKNTPDMGWAALTIAIVIISVDQLFWRPLVAWADKFRVEQSSSVNAPESWVYDLFTTARIPRLLGQLLRPVGDTIDRLLSTLTPAKTRQAVAPDRNRSIGSDRYL